MVWQAYSSIVKTVTMLCVIIGVLLFKKEKKHLGWAQWRDKTSHLFNKDHSLVLSISIHSQSSGERDLKRTKSHSDKSACNSCKLTFFTILLVCKKSFSNRILFFLMHETLLLCSFYLLKQKFSAFGDLQQELRLF